MKKLLALLLAAVMCFSLAACGGNKPANTETNLESHGNITADGNNEDSTTEVTTEQIDYKTILMNGGAFWSYTNHTYMTAFCEDSTTKNPDGVWALNGNIVECTLDDGSTATYEIKELNGLYYLVGERDIMYGGNIIPSEIPAKSVEITLDNWQEYFELGSASCEVIDQFGEPTGETNTSHFLRLKDEYYRYLIESNSEVLLRFTINGDERDSNIHNTDWDTSIHTFYFGVNNVEVGEDDVFEMVKIQGTLYFVDGL